MTEQDDSGIRIPTGRRDEIEITTKMLNVGTEMLIDWEPAFQDPRAKIADIYRAMRIIELSDDSDCGPSR